jgi:hypothetical protein
MVVERIRSFIVGLVLDFLDCAAVAFEAARWKYHSTARRQFLDNAHSAPEVSPEPASV